MVLRLNRVHAIALYVISVGEHFCESNLKDRNN